MTRSGNPLKDQLQELIEVAMERGLVEAATVLRRLTTPAVLVFRPAEGESGRFDPVEEVFFSGVRRTASATTSGIELDAFNALFEEAEAELRETSLGGVAFAEAIWRELADAPVDIPSEIELVSQNDAVKSITAGGAQFTTHEVLRAVEALERSSRAADSHPDRRHVYFEGLVPERNHPGRYRTCWGS